MISLPGRRGTVAPVAVIVNDPVLGAVLHRASEALEFPLQLARRHISIVIKFEYRIAVKFKTGPACARETGLCAIVVQGLPMSMLAKPFLSPEEYLEIERKAEYKNEYFQGEMFAMSGVSRRHDRINVRLTSLVDQHLRGKRCEAFSASMRVLAASSGLYTYPDLSVACDEPQFADPHVDTLTNRKIDRKSTRLNSSH